MTVRILTGHVLDRLAELPDESVHCVVTSPPYWGLRDYGTPPQIWGGRADCRHRWGNEAGRLRSHPQQSRNGQKGVVGPRDLHPSAARTSIDASQGAFCQRCGAWRGSLGLEPAYQLYVEHLVAVLREVRRVLRGDGTLWLNLGDCYATGAGKAGLKPKDLVGIPWRVAFALQDDGWWLRRDNVWAKPNGMPESVRDRCTTAHEYLFHFSKSARYFYDSEATKEPAANTGGGTRAAPDKAARAGIVMNKGLATNGTGATTLRAKGAATRYKRSVWAVASAPYAGAHFATFPPALIEPCILAGTSAKGVCPKCGAPWVRVVDRASRDDCRYTDTGFPGEGKDRGRRIASGGVGIGASAQTIGWRAACSCDAGAVPAVVLDPFLGAGTTARVADRFARDCIGIELLPKYAAMADRRTREPGLALA